MSFILRPDFSIQQTQLITILTALAVSQSIERTLNIKTDIKWLNDIFINDRKACGILTEGEITLETGRYEYLVVGVGINVFRDENLPTHLETIYTSLGEHTPVTIDRNTLISDVINSFYDLYSHFPENCSSVIDAYRKLCCTLGKRVVIRDDPTQKFYALNINDYGHLIVRDSNNKLHSLNSGEVSVQGV